MAKAKKETIILFDGVKVEVRAPLDRLMSRDGKKNWIRGYEVFDPEKEHSISSRKGGGFVPLTIKRPRPGTVLVMRAGQTGKPLAIDKRFLRVAGKDSLTFEEVFVQGQAVGAVELQGLAESEVEDLTIGEFQVEELEEDPEKEFKAGKRRSSRK